MQGGQGVHPPLLVEVVVGLVMVVRLLEGVAAIEFFVVVAPSSSSSFFALSLFVFLHGYVCFIETNCASSSKFSCCIEVFRNELKKNFIE